MKKRNAGINLFKLFSMFMIALLHVLGMGGITGAAAGTSSYYPVYLMQNAAFCASYQKKRRRESDRNGLG